MTPSIERQELTTQTSSFTIPTLSKQLQRRTSDNNRARYARAHFPALHLLPSSQRKSANIVGVYNVRHFGIQNLANPASRYWVPHFPNVPSEAVESVGLLRAPKRPVKIVDWEPIHPNSIPILYDFGRPRVQTDDDHDMAATNQGFRQFSRRLFGAANTWGG